MKLFLITGFLGSGKTTFLSNLLNEFKDNKIGVIINEFGQEGIDGKLIKNDFFEMKELNNGSIFCSCIKDNFIKAITELANLDIEYIFVEATGLADPSNIENIVNFTQGINKTSIEYGGSVCIVDALYFIEQQDLLPSLRSQIEYSQIVIINKIDLQKKGAILIIKNIIKDINKDSQIYETSFCNIKIKDAILNIDKNKKEYRPSSNTQETRPKSITIIIDEVINIVELKKYLEKISPFTYRIKGFVDTSEGIKEISVVGNQININNWNKKIEKSKLIIISSIGIKIVSEVTNNWTLKNKMEMM